MKRKIILAVAIMFLSGFALVSMLRESSQYYEKYEDYKYGFIPYYSTIEKKPTDGDKAMAQSVINLAHEIMTDTANEIPPNADKLETYAIKYSITEKEISRVEADMNFITADFTFSNGYIWLEYTKTAYDEMGGVIEDGAWLAYWKLKKENGIWKVTRIKEAKIDSAV